MRKVCVAIGSRANYSSIKSVLTAISDHPSLTLQIIVFASAVLDRYGSVSTIISKDGFPISAEINTLVEGENPVTMAKSTGLGLIEMPSVLQRLGPDVVLTVGDRFETMSTVLAAAYMNIPIAHTMGGEVSGTIDESIRHAVTKFSHIHFPASPDAANRIVKLGEKPESVFEVGCPRIDLVSNFLKSHHPPSILSSLESGVGQAVDASSPFLLVSQHPVTTEYAHAEIQMTATLSAVSRSGLPAIVLWPNSDAGSDGVSRGIRKWREKHPDCNMRFYKNLPIDTYIYLMKNAQCLIGNSSSGIREGAFIGTPVVNIGTRQTARERSNNVLDVSYETDSIYDAIMSQVSAGHYDSSHLYGSGDAGLKIADILSTCNLNINKTICY